MYAYRRHASQNSVKRRCSRVSTMAVAVALQHFGADGFRYVFDQCLQTACVWGVLWVAVYQRVNDGGLRPLVELLHEARLLLFGHGFVPFGQAMTSLAAAACLAHRKRSRAAGCPAASMALAYRLRDRKSTRLNSSHLGI